MATDLREQQNRMRTTSTATFSTTAMASAGGGLAEAVCGVVVVGLSIAALAGAYPRILAGSAQIVFGIGLLCADAGAGTFFARFWRGGRTANVPFAAGLGAEAIGGLAGIVLGILTLVNLVPFVLTAVCVIVFGASVILGGSARARLAMQTANRLGGMDEEMVQEAHTMAIGGRGLIGLAAIILGILSVVLAASASAGGLVLALVGLLCLGAGSLLTGTALSGQLLATSNR
jgi:hypothetical protein